MFASVAAPSRARRRPARVRTTYTARASLGSSARPTRPIFSIGATIRVTLDPSWQGVWGVSGAKESMFRKTPWRSGQIVRPGFGDIGVEAESAQSAGYLACSVEQAVPSAARIAASTPMHAAPIQRATFGRAIRRNSNDNPELSDLRLKYSACYRLATCCGNAYQCRRRGQRSSHADWGYGAFTGSSGTSQRPSA